MQLGSFPRQSALPHASYETTKPSSAAKKPLVTSSAASMSTEYSYDKPPETSSKPKRSIRQRVKRVLKDLGTSPFEAEDRQRETETAGWLSSMPPSKI